MSDMHLDPTVADWLAEGPERGPRHALDRALAATRRVNQRPGWSFPTRWLPRPVAEVRISASALVGLGLLLALLLLLALAVTIGSRPPHINSPFGVAGDQLIAYSDGSAIYAARFDGSAKRLLSGNVPYARSPVFSPDGSHVAFVGTDTAGSAAGRLLVTGSGGDGALRDIAPGLAVVASDLSNFVWSPDGTQVAFTANDGTASRIFVALSDGSGTPAAITDSTADSDFPTWSADSQVIGFRVTDGDGVHKHLREVRLSTSEVSDINNTVASDSFISKPRLRPVGDGYAYTLNIGFGSTTTAVLDRGFGHFGTIWQGIGGMPEAGVTWSPNGELMAFVSAADGIIVAPNDNNLGLGDPKPYDQQTQKVGFVADCWVDWAPDGKSLIGGSPGGCQGIVAVPLDKPSAAVELPTTTAGVASWQPLTP